MDKYVRRVGANILGKPILSLGLRPFLQLEILERTLLALVKPQLIYNLLDRELPCLECGLCVVSGVR
jgi:hypothetical protein